MTTIIKTDTTTYIHSHETSLLWKVRVSGSTRTYKPADWSTHKHRILEAYQSQDFSAVRFLLVKTGETRYYPVPQLLNLKAEVPYFAEEAMKNLIWALENEFGEVF